MKLRHLLDRFLGTDTSHLARGSFWLAIGSGVGMLVGFFLSMAYARYLSKEMYGDYRYILSIISMAGILALPGLGLAMTRSIARGLEGTFVSTSKIMFRSSFAISMVSIGMALFFFSRGTTQLAWGFLTASLLVPFVEGLGNWKGYLNGKQEFKKKTLFNIFIQIFYGICMIVAIFSIYIFRLSSTVSVILLVGTYLTTHALPNVLFQRHVRKRIPPNAPEDSEAIRYGIHLSLADIPAAIATYIDSVLLYHFLGPSALAIYSFAIVLPEQLKAVLTNAVTVSFSKLSAHTEDAVKAKRLQTIPVRALKASLISGILILSYILAAPFLYKLFFPQYGTSVVYSQIFALSLIFFPFSIFNAQIDAEGNTKKVYLNKIGAPVLQIISLFILIPIFGLWGAVIGRVLGRQINYAFSLFLSMRLGSDKPHII